MNIQIDTEQLFEKSNAIKAINSELQDIVKQIETVVFSTSGEWQGESEKAHFEKIMYVKEQFAEISVFFEEYSGLLRDFAFAYEEQEKDLASKINLA